MREINELSSLSWADLGKNDISQVFPENALTDDMKNLDIPLREFTPEWCYILAFACSEQQDCSYFSFYNFLDNKAGENGCGTGLIDDAYTSKFPLTHATQAAEAGDYESFEAADEDVAAIDSLCTKEAMRAVLSSVIDSSDIPDDFAINVESRAKILTACRVAKGIATKEAAPAEEEAAPAESIEDFLGENITEIRNVTLETLDDFYKALLDGQFAGILARCGNEVSAYSVKNGQLSKLGTDASWTLSALVNTTHVLDNSEPLDADANVYVPPADIVKVWYANGRKTTYYPALHLRLLSGVLPDGSVSLMYSKHQSYVKDMVNEMFCTLVKLMNEHKVDHRDRNVYAYDLVKLMTKMVVVQKFDFTTLLSLATTECQDVIVKTLTDDKISSQVFGREAMKPLTKGGALSTLVNKTGVTGMPNLYSITVSPNLDAYKKDINFAYKAVIEMEKRGKKSNFGSVLLGTMADGTQVTMNMEVENTFCVPIFAGSGSGKGVMTLATLGTAIATGHPFVYLDNKPDMAAMLWGIEHELCEAGFSARFLAVDAAILSLPAALETPKYIPARISKNLKYGQTNEQRGLSALRNWFQSAEMKGVSDIATFATASLIGKMSQLILMCDNGTLAGGKRMLAIVDECNSLSAYYAEKGGIADVMRDSVDISALRKSENTEFLNQFSKIVKTMNLVMPTGKATAINQSTPGELSTRVAYYLNTSGRQNNAVLLSCIGQIKHTIGALFPWKQCIDHPNSSPILGTGNLDPRTYAMYEANSEGALPTGVFVVNGKRCKSYLTLNENDYFREDHAYYGAGLKPHKFTGGICKNRSTSWINQNMGTKEQPQEAVGFWGYVQLLAKVNNVALDDIVKTMNMGYDRAWQVLQNSGIVAKHGYTCIEDWLYDLDPMSYYSIQELNPTLSEDAYHTNDVDTTVGTDIVSDYDSVKRRYGSDTDVEPQSQPIAPAPLPSNAADVYDSSGNSQQPSPAPSDTSDMQPQPQMNPNQDIRPAPLPLNPPPQPIEPRPLPVNQQPAPQTVMTTGYGGQQNAADTTSQASAYQQPVGTTMSFNTGSKPGDNPIAIYAGGKGKWQAKMLRSKMTALLMKEISNQFGGLKDITSFEEQNGILIFNHTPFTPKLPEAEVSLLPPNMQADLTACRYAKIFDWDYLTQLKNLVTIKFSSTSLCEEVFWKDVSVAPRPLTASQKGLKKRWHKLTSFYNGSAEILNFTQPGDEALSESERRTVQKERAEKTEAEMTARERGRNFAVGLATMLGFDPPSADEHPFMQKLSKSHPMRAVRTGAAFTAAAAVGYGILTLANPWLLLFGALTAGTYVKNRIQDHRNNNR